MKDKQALMFAAFTGKPMILRLYGKATAIHQRDPQWASLYPQFDPLPGARQIFILDIDLVQTSCGMAVPLFDYIGDRESLNNWAEKQGEVGIREYWRQKNQHSIDGIETDIVSKNIS